MEYHSIIGGEFECVNSYNKSEPNTFIKCNPYTYSSGRAALYHILQSCKKTFLSKIIYLPDYLCSTIIDTVEKVGLKYEFYPINSLEASEIHLEDLNRGG